jgi:uncharacterized protein YcfJ
MFKKIATTMLVGATLVVGAAAPAEARRHYYDNGYGQSYDYRYGGYDRQYQGRDNYYRRSNYGSHRCYDKGNGGLAIGAIAGGLLGNAVAGRGDKTLGAVLGAAGGGLLGRSIDRSDGRPC